MFAPSVPRKKRPPINLVQGDSENGGFKRGYISTLADSRMPVDGLADMTNMTIEQDGLPRPRPSLVPYGEAYLGECIGTGKFTKFNSGVPERWEISMQVIAGVGTIHIRKDGTAWAAIVDADNSYDDEAWCMFTQNNNRVYVSNGVNTMSYYDINAGTVVKYSAIANPSAPSLTKGGLAGSTYTLYYKISANNNVGTTAASAADSETVGKLRESWVSGTDYMDITWSAVAGATSYNIYVGTAAGQEKFLTTVDNVLAWRDDGTIAADPISEIPLGNSTAGPKLTYLWNKNGQLFGVGDPDNPSYLWFSGTGTASGDFSPFNGGGFVAIDYGGDSTPNAVWSFRDGKGNSALTILTRGSATRGKLYHAVPASTTYGDTVITYFDVYEANGLSGTVSPLGVVEANNSLYYPTGDAIKSTGTTQSVFNILATDSISQAIEPDIQNLNLAAMHKCVGLEFEGKVYWSVPYGSDENNQIWVLDLTRKGLWILRWTVAAKTMWVYEDNDGINHFCVLTQDNDCLEFTRAVATQDNGEAFSTRLASGALTWDKNGVAMGSIEQQRFKLLYPTGTINVRAYGLGEDAIVGSLANETFTATTSFTAYGEFDYEGTYSFEEYDNEIDFFSTTVEVVLLEIDEIVNELTWEITTDTPNCDYFGPTVLTTGKLINRLYYGD